MLLPQLPLAPHMMLSLHMVEKPDDVPAPHMMELPHRPVAPHMMEEPPGPVAPHMIEDPPGPDAPHMMELPPVNCELPQTPGPDQACDVPQTANGSLVKVNVAGILVAIAVGATWPTRSQARCWPGQGPNQRSRRQR